MRCAHNKVIVVNGFDWTTKTNKGIHTAFSRSLDSLESGIELKYR